TNRLFLNRKVPHPEEWRTVLLDTSNCLVWTNGAAKVGLIGVRDLAVVVEPDAVLVINRAASQGVKRLAEQMALAQPPGAPSQIALSQPIANAGRADASGRGRSEESGFYRANARAHSLPSARRCAVARCWRSAQAGFSGPGGGIALAVRGCA